MRFLENHDQARAAERFGSGALLRNWTLFAMLLEGCFLAYMGQERAIARKPSLFEADPVPWTSGDASFEPWFTKAHSLTKAIRAREERFAATELADGLVLIERSGGPRPVSALLNLRHLSGSVKLPPGSRLHGRDLLTGAPVMLSGTIEIASEPILVEEENH